MLSDKIFENVEQRAEQAEKETRWFAFTGKVFGDQSPTPLKVEVRYGGEDFNRGWTSGMQEYARSLAPNKRKRFNQSAANPMTIPSDALIVANRFAIRAANTIVRVAACGPVLEFLDRPLPEVLQKRYHLESLPDEIKALYKRRGDGWYEIPLQTAPPESFIATEEQVQRWMKYGEFVNQVADFRRELSDETSEGDEDELGNSVSGSARAGLGLS